MKVTVRREIAGDGREVWRFESAGDWYITTDEDFVTFVRNYDAGTIVYAFANPDDKDGFDKRFGHLIP
jgi:hypothetical protein